MCNVYFKNEDAAGFLRALPDRSVDLVLTDPPYGISRSTNFSSGQPTGRDTDRFRVSMDFGEWDCGGDLSPVIAEFYRVLRPHGSVVCFYDLWKIGTLKEILEGAGFRQARFLEWIKTNPVPLNSKSNYLTNAREAAVSVVKGDRPVFHSEYDNAVYSFPICHDRGRFHPTQKPLALIRELVRKHSDSGGVILDCFAGSATTAVAAFLEGRSFIGCEIDRGYYGKAVRRLKETGITDCGKLPW